MGDEPILVIGDHGAVGHHQRCVKVLVVDGLQRIDVEPGRAIDQVIHCRADGGRRVRGWCHGINSRGCKMRKTDTRTRRRNVRRRNCLAGVARSAQERPLRGKAARTRNGDGCDR